jgi:hypothetical protein
VPGADVGPLAVLATNTARQLSDLQAKSLSLSQFTCKKTMRPLFAFWQAVGTVFREALRGLVSVQAFFGVGIQPPQDFIGTDGVPSGLPRSWAWRLLLHPSTRFLPDIVCIAVGHNAGKQLVTRFAAGKIAVILVQHTGRSWEMRGTSKREGNVFGLSH